MELDELLRAGLCDCGLPLDGHPPLPPVKPWQGWRSERINGAMARQARSATSEAHAFRKRFSPKASRTPRNRWAEMSEEQRAADRAASRRYYEAHRAEILERRREAWAAKQAAA